MSRHVLTKSRVRKGGAQGSHMHTYLYCTQMGLEALEGLRFLASLPLAGTGQREGGGFSCINKRIISYPVTAPTEIIEHSSSDYGHGAIH